MTFKKPQFLNFSTISALGLFKFAALELINSIEDHEQRVQLSINYQTLCDATAMVGVIELQSKAQVNKEMLSLKKVAFDKRKIEQDTSELQVSSGP